MNIKLNDVYRFTYNDEYIEKSYYDPYHCFDGQLIVKENSDGELYLVDTYWIGSGGSKWFTLEEALKKGSLKIKCNLDEVEKIQKWELDYYDDKDLFDLSTQHYCYKEYYKRKNAKKSPVKMRKVLDRKIEKLRSEIDYRKNELDRSLTNLEELKKGNIDIHI